MNRKSAYRPARHSAVRFSKRRVLVKDNKVELLPGNSWDRWLTRVSFFAQIATPILAVLGFWYTVLPLYSKAILEEQVAKSQIDFEKQQGSLRELTAAVDIKRQEADSLAAQMKEEKERSLSLRQDISLLSIERSKAQIVATSARQEAVRQYQLMRASVISTALDRASFCLFDINKWETFYSPMRKWYRDDTPAVKGERYPDLGSAETCVPRLIRETYGFDGLGKDDKALLDVQLAKLTAQLKLKFEDLDEEFAQARDTNIDEDNSEESRETYWSRVNKLSGEARVKAINESAAQRMEKTDRQMRRTRALGENANSLIKQATHDLAAHFRDIGWLSKQSLAGAK